MNNTPVVGDILDMASQQAMSNQNQAYNYMSANATRDWQESMDDSKMQRYVKDLQKAGLNPALAYTGIPSVPSAKQASVSGTMNTGFGKNQLEMKRVKNENKLRRAAVIKSGAETEALITQAKANSANAYKSVQEGELTEEKVRLNNQMILSEVENQETNNALQYKLGLESLQIGLDNMLREVNLVPYINKKGQIRKSTSWIDYITDNLGKLLNTSVGVHYIPQGKQVNPKPLKHWRP